jgi:hypothetical protein
MPPDDEVDVARTTCPRRCDVACAAWWHAMLQAAVVSAATLRSTHLAARTTATTAAAKSSKRLIIFVNDNNQGRTRCVVGARYMPVGCIKARTAKLAVRASRRTCLVQHSNLYSL